MTTLKVLSADLSAVDGRSKHAIIWIARALREAGLITAPKSALYVGADMSPDDAAALLCGLYGGTRAPAAARQAARLLALPRRGPQPDYVGDTPDGLAGLAVAETFGDALMWIAGRLPWLLLHAARVERAAGADVARIERVLEHGEAGYNVIEVEFGAEGWANIFVQDRRGAILARGFGEDAAADPAARKRAKLVGPAVLLATWRSVAGPAKVDAAMAELRRRLDLPVASALEVA